VLTPSRREFLRILGSGIGVALLTACSSAAPRTTAGTAVATTPAPTGGTTSSTSATAGGPRPRGTLRVGALGDLQNLEPHITGLNTDTIYHVWDKLLEYDDKLQPQPRLAESWDVSGDGKQIVLHLRQGVQWHSGREFTSQDVVWNFNRIKTDPAVGGTGFPNLVAPLSAAETPDANTVVMRAEGPWPGVFNLLSLLNIADPVSMGSLNAKTTAIGTGPFQFVEWVQGDHLTLKKNPTYWRGGKPYLDGVTYSLFTDPQAMVTALEAGSIDVADMPPLRDTARLQKDTQYTVLFNQTTGNKYVLSLQTKQAPTDNKVFRQALQYALDRPRIVDTVLLGIGVPSQIPFTPTSPGYDPAKDRFYAFDLDKARALVTSSGISNPTLDFNYATTSAEWSRIGQLYQADLAKIGVTLNLKPVEPVAGSAMLRARSFNGAYASQSIFTQLHPAMFDGNPYYTMQPNNWANFNSPRLTQLMTGFVTETDQVRAKQYYSDFNDYLLDEAWNIVIATNVPREIATGKVHDLRYNMVEMFVQSDAWLSA
jgi:peptide/nickel transport system substrate-binding protein